MGSVRLHPSGKRHRRVRGLRKKASGRRSRKTFEATFDRDNVHKVLCKNDVAQKNENVHQKSQHEGFSPGTSELEMHNSGHED